MKMDTEAQDAWKKAGEYCAFALEKLMLRPTLVLGGEDAPTHDAIMVHFLFPNLAEAERSLLFSVQELSRTVNRGVQCAESGTALSNIELGLRAAEEMYTDLKNRIHNSGLLEKLTRVQRQIVESEFLAIRFRE